MSLLGLASYGSDDSGSEDEVEAPTSKAAIEGKNEDNNEISDEEDFPVGESLSLLDQEDPEDIPGLSSSKSFFASLPTSTSSRVAEAKPAEKESFIDENEDLASIPKAKVYSETPDLKAIKPKKKKGPVRIMAPSLVSNLDDDDLEKKRPLIQGPAKIKSGLSSLLPPPKSSSTNWSKPVQASSSGSKPANVGLVPRSLTRKPPPLAPKAGKSSVAADSDDESDVPFFSMTAESVSAASSSAALATGSFTVKSNPEAANPKKFHPSHQFRYSEDLDYGPATAPYPPPAPGPRPQGPPEDLLANEAALERLAGRGNKKRKGEEGLNHVIDVNFEDIKPDEREWLTKALTEEEADKPGPRNTIGGNMKRKHQITYLAAVAKEREHELKKQWAESASNRRAAASKYGF